MLSGKESLQEVKDKLTAYGISTSTPGLKGDERFQELLKRLAEVQMKESEFLEKDDVRTEIESIEAKYNVPSVSDLSLSEIRSRLTMLGENTNTPGLSGEERRNELLKRLINCICRSEDTGDHMIDEIVEEKQTIAVDQSIQSQTETLPPPVVTEISDLQTESTTSRIEKLKKEERIRTTELSEIKKHMNNLINRRAMVISSRYEGANQDEKLRKLGSYIDQIEQEISRVQNAMKKNRNGKTHTSSALVENNSMMPAEKLLAKLSKELESTKEKIKRQKNMIKIEEENNQTYGIEAEEIDKIRIQELSYQISKLKRDIEKVSVGVTISSESSLTTDSPHFQNNPSLESQSKEYQVYESVSKAKKKEEVQKKTKHQEPLDIGFTEEELMSMKPFEPYKDDSDDLLALKMNMLKNRQKATHATKITPPVESKTEVVNDKEIHIQPPSQTEKPMMIPEIGGSTTTAFSSRRRAPPPAKNDQTASSINTDPPQKDTKQQEETLAAQRLTAESKIARLRQELSQEDETQKKNMTDVTDMSQKDTKQQEETLAAPRLTAESKIARLRQELSQEDDSNEEDEDCVDDDDAGIDDQIRSLRAEALSLEKNHDYDAVEEIYVKALTMKPLDVRTLDVFATFLHRRKGEMGRAEAFYRRAIQICLPSLIEDLASPSKIRNHEDWNKIFSGETLLPTPNSPPEGKSSLSVKKLTSVLLHYANFLRRAKGDLDLAEIVLRKAAEISPHDDVILGNCAHHLAEEAYDTHNHYESKNTEKIDEYRREASDLFRRAMKANPTNVMNMLWYAKFLHKTNQIIQAEIMYKAAIKASNLQGKKAATAICNYAIFLYRHKKDPEQAAKLFCDGIERFPNHRGIQKNYRAMKKELEKAVQTRQSGSISHEENLSRESNANTAKMAGMRAKLYNDVQNAEDYHISEVENDDGSFLFSIHHISCHLEHENPEEFAIYWLFNAGSGSISDRSYESSILPLQQHLEWKFSLDQNQNSPRASVTCNDHLCFEFYLMKKIDIQSKKSNFIGSIILPIEDLLHDHIPQSHTSKSRAFQSIEEPIMSDDGEVIGQMKLQYLLQ